MFEQTGVILSYDLSWFEVSQNLSLLASWNVKNLA